MRILLSLITGSVIAGLLFLLMNTMISMEETRAIEHETERLAPYRAQPRDERVETRERRMPDPPDERRPPPVDHRKTRPVEPPRPDIDFPEIDVAPNLDSGVRMDDPRNGRQKGNGRAEVLVRVEPQIPRRAAIQGIEGWVRVRFTIRTDGSVTNARVVESRPGRVFNRSALQAIERWRFRPRIVDGRPVERQATQEFEFRLEERH